MKNVLGVLRKNELVTADTGGGIVGGVSPLSRGVVRMYGWVYMVVCGALYR